MPSTITGLRTTAEAVSAPYLLHHVRVTGVVDLSPTFARITVTGPQLDLVRPTGRDQRIKIMLPLPEVGLDPMPMVDDWYPLWRALPNDQRNPMRTYTVRAVRPGERELDIDVVRHGATGPAGAWIERARAGDELIINAPNAAYEGETGGIDFDPPVGMTQVLLAGDETAVPAIASILESLPADITGHVVVEVPHVEDIGVLPSPPGVDRRVVVRGAVRGEALDAAVRDVAPGLVQAAASPSLLEEVDIDAGLLWEVPRDDDGMRDATSYAWLAGEAAVIKNLRRYLVSELGWDRKAVAFMGYWREGRAEDNG